MKDKELLELLRGEPQKGLAAVVERYSAYVIKIARTKLGGLCTNEDIEELVSDVFYGFYRHGCKCGFEIRSPRGCLAIIAERRCIDLIDRIMKNGESISIDEIADFLPDEIPTDDHSRLTEALKRLGEPDTSIFIRKYFLGQRTADIAMELHMKPNTVDKRISRGLVRLRKILEEEM